MYAIVIHVTQTANVEALAHSYNVSVTVVTMATDIAAQVTSLRYYFQK